MFRVWQFFVYSNLLIAFAAGGQSILTYIVLGIPVDWFVVMVEWSATMMLYGFIMWFSMLSTSNDSPQKRTQWYFKNKMFFLILFSVSTLLFFFFLLKVSLNTVCYLCLVGFLSLGYAFPFFSWKGKKISLRQIAGLKVFLIALVWSLSVVGIPVVEYWSRGNQIEIPDICFWFTLVFLFVLGITIPFDIRDMKQDQYYNLKTIPVLVGEASAKYLCFGLIVLHMLIVSLVPTILWTLKITFVAVDILVLSIFYSYIFQKNANYERVYVLDLILVIQSGLGFYFLSF